MRIRTVVQIRHDRLQKMKDEGRNPFEITTFDRANSAQQIVEEIGKLVKQNINLMDETGHIIASNDPSRIGNFPVGAYRIITNHLKELYITPELEQTLPLVRQGINLPIEVDGNVTLRVDKNMVVADASAQQPVQK